MKKTWTIRYKTDPDKLLQEHALPVGKGEAPMHKAVKRLQRELGLLHRDLQFDAQPSQSVGRKGKILVHTPPLGIDLKEARGIFRDAGRLWGDILTLVCEYPEVVGAMTDPELAMIRRASATTITDPSTALAALAVLLELAARLAKPDFWVNVQIKPEKVPGSMQVDRMGRSVFECRQVCGLADLPVWCLIHEVAHLITRVNTAPDPGSEAEPVEMHGPEYVEWLKQLMELVRCEEAIQAIEAMVRDREAAPIEPTLPPGWMGGVREEAAHATWWPDAAADGASPDSFHAWQENRGMACC